MQHATPEGTAADTRFHEQVSIKVVKGKDKTFVRLYVPLAIFFSFSFIMLILCAILIGLASIFGKAQADDVFTFFRLIAAFDFGSGELQNVTGPQTDALIIAYAMAGGIVLLVLSVIFGVALKSIKRRFVSQKTVAALLPGRKRGFIPCSEGIYKVCYYNLWTKNRYYSLYPWESLSLYAINEKKKRIVLKTGKIQMPLIPWNKVSNLFYSLKAVVLGHLPPEKQTLPQKKDRYRWSRVIVAAAVAIALYAVLAIWLDSATVKGAGTDYCDVRGTIHYSFRPAFSTEYSYFEMRDVNGNPLHKYCELHGVIFVMLHPWYYIPALSSLSQAPGSPVRTAIFIEMLVLPAIIWINSLFIIFYSGKPRNFRFNVL